MTKQNAVVALAVLAAAGVLGACGGQSSSGGGSQGAKPSPASSGQSQSGAQGNKNAKATKPETLSVQLTEMKITPADPKVKKPGVVDLKIHNAGKTVHALAVKGPKGLAKTPTLQPGKSATLKVDLTKAGTYRWYCPVDNHASMGMIGKVTVEKG